MTVRKSPYKHKVKSHLRAGIEISHYERGKGKPPRTRRFSSINRTQGYGYNVTLYFDKGRETHKVPAHTLTEAAKQGIRSIRKPEIPRRMKIERIDV